MNPRLDNLRILTGTGHPTLARDIAGQLGVKLVSLSITHTAQLGMAQVILED